MDIKILQNRLGAERIDIQLLIFYVGLCPIDCALVQTIIYAFNGWY